MNVTGTVTKKIAPVALPEHRVILNVDPHVEIAGFASVRPRATFTR